jgi:pyrroloquinoline quinone biosynthesis protein E
MLPAPLLPTFVQVELTYACNSACSFCYNPNHTRSHDSGLTRRILQEVARYRLAHVQLIGGEISTLPDIQEYVDLIGPSKWRSLVTNGRIFMPDLGGRIDEIYFSLHGDKVVHESLTKARDSFDGIIENARRYSSAGILLNCDTVLTSANYEQIYDIACIAHEIGMGAIFVNIYQPAGIGLKQFDRFAPNPGQIRKAIDQLLLAREKLGIQVNFGTSTPYCLDERLLTQDLAYTCGTGTWFASIDPLGGVRICNQSPKAYGNILNETLGGIWSKAEIRSDYRDLSWLPEPCGSCSLRAECIGGCRISDKGHARIDPIVERYPDELLSASEIARLVRAHRPLVLSA